MSLLIFLIITHLSYIKLAGGIAEDQSRCRINRELLATLCFYGNYILRQHFDSTQPSLMGTALEIMGEIIYIARFNTSNKVLYNKQYESHKEELVKVYHL